MILTWILSSALLPRGCQRPYGLAQLPRGRPDSQRLSQTLCSSGVGLQGPPLSLALLSVSNGTEKYLGSHLFSQHPLPLLITVDHTCVCAYEPSVIEMTQAWPLNHLALSLTSFCPGTSYFSLSLNCLLCQWGCCDVSFVPSFSHSTNTWRTLDREPTI